MYPVIRQLGFVVRDIESSMKRLTQMQGFGPWLYRKNVISNDFYYMGRKQDSITINAAFTMSGPMQIELIEQRCETPSTYRDFLSSRGEGLQHWAIWAEDYDDAVNHYAALGLLKTQEGGNAAGRFSYFSDTDSSQPIMEVLELTESRRAFFSSVARQCASWDGSAPIRPVD